MSDIEKKLKRYNVWQLVGSQWTLVEDSPVEALSRESVLGQHSGKNGQINNGAIKVRLQ